MMLIMMLMLVMVDYDWLTTIDDDRDGDVCC
jgi:hypothetical protein